MYLLTCKNAPNTLSEKKQPLQNYDPTFIVAVFLKKEHLQLFKKKYARVYIKVLAETTTGDYRSPHKEQNSFHNKLIQFWIGSS